MSRLLRMVAVKEGRRGKLLQDHSFWPIKPGLGFKRFPAGSLVVIHSVDEFVDGNYLAFQVSPIDGLDYSWYDSTNKRGETTYPELFLFECPNKERRK